MTANAFTAGAMLAVALPLCLLLTEDSLLPLVALPGLIVLLAAFTAGFGLLLVGASTSTSATSSTSWRPSPCPGSS